MGEISGSDGAISALLQGTRTRVQQQLRSAVTDGAAGAGRRPQGPANAPRIDRQAVRAQQQALQPEILPPEPQARGVRVTDAQVNDAFFARRADDQSIADRAAGRDQAQTQLLIENHINQAASRANELDAQQAQELTQRRQDRVEQDQAALFQSQIDQRLSEQRLAGADPDAALPRGSIVDIEA